MKISEVKIIKICYRYIFKIDVLSFIIKSDKFLNILN
jgi:hypothetical protein